MPPSDGLCTSADDEGKAIASNRYASEYKRYIGNPIDNLPQFSHIPPMRALAILAAVTILAASCAHPTPPPRCAPCACAYLDLRDKPRRPHPPRLRYVPPIIYDLPAKPQYLDPLATATIAPPEPGH